MSEFAPIETRAVLELQGKGEILAGYQAGFRGDPEPGSSKSRGYWHGWRNGMTDSGRMSKDDAQAALAKECVRASRAH